MPSGDVGADDGHAPPSPIPAAGSLQEQASKPSDGVETTSKRSASPAMKRPASELDENLEMSDPSAEVGSSSLRLISVPPDGTAPEAILADGASTRRPDIHHLSPTPPTVVHETAMSLDLPIIDDQDDAMSELDPASLPPSIDGREMPKSELPLLPSLRPSYQHANNISTASTDKGLSDRPSVDEQIAQVTALTMRPLRDGDRGHVVSCTWLERVKARRSETVSVTPPNKRAGEGEVGPVDNSGLVASLGEEWRDLKDETGEPFVPLKPGLVMGEDFEIFPEGAWELIERWYGRAPNSPKLVRFVHNTNSDGEVGGENLQYEVNPPLFTVVKVRHDGRSQPSGPAEAKPFRTLASRSEGFNHFLRRVKLKVGIPLQGKVRVWRIIRQQGLTDGNGIMDPVGSGTASPALGTADVFAKLTETRTLEVQDFISLEEGTQREVLEVQDQTGNDNYNGRMSLALAGLSQDEVIVLEERVREATGLEWVSEASRPPTTNAGIPITITKGRTTTVHNDAKSKPLSDGRRAGPARAGPAVLTRGRGRKNGRAMGTCGLSNLGNTCYMNSALQCVRSVEELTQYCRLEKYKADLNPSNPLSYKGEIARSYANLLQLMYAPTCPPSIAPRAFKNTIGRHGPSFSGYGQQDSQEFLGFLLDGLQEDLNRIQKKPYVENPDSTDDMVHNPVALRAMADKCWELYKARNDSVVVDLFAGTYKSTLICPVCKKVSITFDPFNNLTLQLPVENAWGKEVCFLPLNARPVRIMVDMDKSGSIRSLKEFVGARVKVEPERLHAVEVYKSKVYRAYEDFACVSETIMANDEVFVYELEAVPTNWPSPPRRQARTRSVLHPYSASDDDDERSFWDSPLAEKLLVPIFQRTPPSSSSRLASWSLDGLPTYIILSRQEASDYDAIFRKVLTKIDTLTTFDLLEDGSDPSATSPEDDVVVVASTEDTDSSAETRTKVRSVDGEDDLVAVDLKRGDQPSKAERFNTNKDSRGPSHRRDRTAKVLRPGGSFPPEFRNMFQMRAFEQGEDLVPTGWNSNFDTNRDYPSIESRIPVPPRTSSSGHDTDDVRMPGEAASSESDDAQYNSKYVNRSFSAREPVDSDSEIDQLPPMRSLLSTKNGSTPKSANWLRGGNRRSEGRLKRTYSKKGRNSHDDGVKRAGPAPLIRLGEGIFLDWDTKAHRTLFGGTGPKDPMRGVPTWEHAELLPDKDLQRKLTQRSDRRRKGITLEDCLDEFGKEEILSENNAWYCPKCKEFRRASKKFELWKSPDILIIHLKRFSASRGLRDKLDVLVDFPVDGLDLTERVAMKDNGKLAIYDLFAVDNHYGGLGGGHYTAVARNFIDGEWYDYNDTMTSKRSPQHAVTNAAYLLFYRRRSDRPLGGPYFEKIIEESNGSDESAPSSRASSSSSSAGNGQRLKDDEDDDNNASRVGLSRALITVDASHPGTSAVMTSERLITEREGLGDEEPPGYRSLYPASGGSVSNRTGMDRMDVDEGVDTGYSLQPPGPFSSNIGWAFSDARDEVDTTIAGPAGSSDEGLMDGASDRAADGSSTSLSDQADRMADFAADDDDDDDNVDAALPDSMMTPLLNPSPVGASRGGSPVPEEDGIIAHQRRETSMYVNALLYADDYDHDQAVDDHKYRDGHFKDQVQLEPAVTIKVDGEQQQQQYSTAGGHDENDGTAITTTSIIGVTKEE